MQAFPRERFSAEVALSPGMVAAFATAAGDDNPIHDWIHDDPAFAAKGQDGRTALGAKGRILITEQL